MRRAHSVFEMRRALERRADEKTLVQRVLARLRERQYLDDARYAMQFVRQRSANRRQGRHRIAHELRARGVPDRHIEAAIEEVLRDVQKFFPGITQPGTGYFVHFRKFLR